MNKIKKHLSSYLRSKELYDLGVQSIIGLGEYFYDVLDQEMYISLSDEKDEIIKSMHLNTLEMVTLNRKRCVKAYLSSEIGELLPLEYMLPRPFEEGWALVSEDGEIILVEHDDFYESEIEARITFLIYFLKLKLLKPENLKL